MSSNPAKYAQLRRDAEIGARQELQQLIPQRYIDDVPECEPRDNPMTKVVKASVAYIKDIVGGSSASTNSNNQPSSVFTPSRTEVHESLLDRIEIFQTDSQLETYTQASRFSPIVPTTPSRLKNNEEYQRLKQAMERVKQHIQGRGHDGEELSDEVKRMMDEATDTLVDIIDNWEGRGQQPQG
ncbi:hypothetical protein G647_09761 [Cladophialophora carrionii CBS 160.54]|uniref:Uncharacterized protein n=1 Tax=Cladophialophora carrionii CBS 160.54 TaxID=1279043 RepID=V9DJJ8_9EURO|nr:uncharacterized protein G647_09761 [Cladophialophora carrionii CBS 160.54]ETI27079.1 hypothetical protein G647_09761 [Cladophialophora carrionii CBS 160.54]